MSSRRFYEAVHPKPDELVMVKVKRIEDMGAYVTLLEYGDLEGLILTSEISKRRFRSINRMVRVGRQEVATVLRVDPEKGYVDLSKKRVAPEEVASCEEKFFKTKKIYLTTRLVASKHGLDVEEVNKLVIWPLYRKYGHAYDALREAAQSEDPCKVFAGIDAPKDLLESIVTDIRQRLLPQCLKIRARIDVFCSGPDGVNAVRKALVEGRRVALEGTTELKKSQVTTGVAAAERMDEFGLEIKLVASPQHAIVMSCFDRNEGVRRIQTAFKTIEETIRSFPGGGFKMQSDLLIIGEEDAQLFASSAQTGDDDAEEGSAGSGESGESEESDEEGMGEVEE